MNIRKACLAEYLGTFAMVFAGCGAIVTNQLSGGQVSHLGVSAVFGLAVATVIYAYGDISGAHINPAVTIAFWVAGRFEKAHVLPYIASQCLGAISASFLLFQLLPGDHLSGATLPSGSWQQSFWMELLLTWWLMAVILSVSEGSKEKGIVAGLVIGGVVMLEAAFAGPISGASMNPARSLGPALASGSSTHLWIYFAGPTLGALLAVGSHRLVSTPKESS